MEIGKLTATTLGQKLRFDVRPGSPVTVGRSNRCTLCVPDPKVSREHCRLEFVDGKVRVTDLASSHGLTYRGHRCAEFEIEVGDGFHIGQTFVRFEAREIGSETAPALEVRRDVPVQVAAAAADDDDEHEHDEHERAADAEPDWLDSAPAEQYPDLPVGGRPTRRRRPARRGGLVGQLLGQLCLYVTIVITTVAVLLALKNHNPDWDVYRLLDLLRPHK